MKPRERIAPLLDQARTLRRRAYGYDRPITAGRIERALVVLAQLMELEQEPRYAPLLDRLERELAVYKQERDPISRARRILRDLTIDAG